MAKDEGNKEQAILQAAETEFIEKGLEGARTVKIAEKAGVTHAMLHYYFRTKEQLFTKIFDEKAALLLNSMKESFNRPDLPVVERIQNAIRVHFEFVRENPKLPLFIIREISSGDTLVKFFTEKALTVFPQTSELRSDLEKEAEKGTICKIDFIDLIMDIISLNASPFLFTGMYRSYLPAVGLTLDEFLEHRKEENVELITRRLKNDRP